LLARRIRGHAFRLHYTVLACAPPRRIGGERPARATTLPLPVKESAGAITDELPHRPHERAGIGEWDVPGMSSTNPFTGWVRR